MASSGTYAFAPDNADILEEAFERCGVDPATLGPRHFRSAIFSTNLLFSDWANDDVQLFACDEQTQTLTDGDPDYTVASGTLFILHSFIRRSGVDTAVFNVDAEQYHMIPDKTSEGLPSQVWLDRRTGIYLFYQVPENSTDVYHYWRVRRLQDAGTGQDNPDVPFRWYEALVSGLAAKLAEKYAPDRESGLITKAAMKLARAKHGDRERGDTSFGMTPL